MSDNNFASAHRPLSLLLDVDGTLLDFAPHPDKVLVSRPLVALLEDLHGLLDSALALVSGRSIQSLDRLFRPFTPTAVGLHGLELRIGGKAGGEASHTIDCLDSEPVPSALAEKVAVVARRFDRSFLEDKAWALVVHHVLDGYRAELLAAELQLACADFAPDWIVLRGRQVFEIKSASITKATGVDRLMRLPVFAGTGPVAFGDDVTDLDMFAAVRRYRGLAVSVGPRIAGAGDLHLSSPASSLQLLEQLAQGLRDRHAPADLFAMIQPGLLQRAG